MDIWKFAQDNIFLIAIAAISGGMLLWPLLQRATGGGAASVDTLQATQMINHQDAVVLDVREQGELASGKILNARAIPLSALEARVKDLERFKGKPIIVCCASGNRSLSAMRVLKKHGFEQVFNLSGGFGAWRQSGLPVEKG